jgi:hypothetical protein
MLTYVELVRETIAQAFQIVKRAGTGDAGYRACESGVVFNGNTGWRTGGV